MPTTRRLVHAKGHDDLARRLLEHRPFHRMIARQQIPLETIAWSDAGEVICHALHNCAQCQVRGVCAKWLAGAEPAASYVRFCPNAETIELLRIMAA